MPNIFMPKDKKITYSDIDNVNRYYKANVFMVDPKTGQISLNKNIPEQSRETWKQVGERLGIREGEYIAEAEPVRSSSSSGGGGSQVVQTQTTPVSSTPTNSGGSTGVGSASTTTTREGKSASWSWRYTGKNVRASDYAPVDVTEEDVLNDPKRAEYILNQNKIGDVYRIQTSSRFEGDIVKTETKTATVSVTSTAPPPSLGDTLIQDLRDKSAIKLTPVGVEEYRANIKNQYIGAYQTYKKYNPVSLMPDFVAENIIEGASQLYVGLEEIRGGIDKRMINTNIVFNEKTQRMRTQTDMLVSGIGRTASTSMYGFVEGAGVGSLIGGGVGVAAGGTMAAVGRNVFITSFKGASYMTAFEGGFDYFLNSGKNLNRIVSAENFVQNMVLGAGIQQVATPIATNIMLQGYGLKTTKALIGATTGATGGFVFAYKYKEPEEGLKYAAVGAAVGGVLGVGDAVLEEHKIRPVIGLVENQRVNIKTGKAVDEFRGVKIGIEHVGKNFEPEFYGGAITREGIYLGTGQKLHGITYGTYKITPNDVVIPKGMLELNLYGGKAGYSQSFKDFASEYFSGVKVNQDIVKQEIGKAAKGDAEQIITSVKKSGGVFGGSVVERGIGDKLTTNPRFARAPSKDVDVVFYSDSSLKEFVKQNPGLTLKPSKTGVESIYNYFIDKYTAVTKAGTKLDISVVHPSIAMPKPPSPMSQYTSLGSFQKGAVMTTYSTQQQLGTKFMTVGAGASGEVKLVEPSKTKYLYDVASMGSKSAETTLAKAESYAKAGGYTLQPSTSQVISSSRGSISIPSSISKGSQSFSLSSIKIPSVSISSSSFSYSVSSSKSSRTSSLSSISSSISSAISSFSSISHPSSSSSSRSSKSSSLSSSISFKYVEPVTFKFEFPMPLGAPLPGRVNLGGIGRGLGKFNVQKDLNSILKPTLKISGFAGIGQPKHKKRGKK